MKLIVCVFLVLVILEEYHCDPCLDFLFKGRNKNNGRPTKIGFGLGLSANTIIQGGSGHKREHRRYSPHRPPSYNTNGLYHRPWYPVGNPHYRNRSPYYPHNGRPFDATSNIPYYRHGTPNVTPQYNTPNGWNQAAIRPHYGGPQYGTGVHQASFGPQYGGPQYGTPYPSPFGTGHQIPNSSPNGSPIYTKNTTPLQTPVEIETPQRKQFFVTPDGIQETPAEPLDNSS